MAKKKAGGKKKSTARASKPKPRRPDGIITHRVTTHKPNGSMSESVEVAPSAEPERVNIGEAMRLAVEELGPVMIDAELAEQQLRDLASDFDEVERRKAAFTAKNDEAKTAKKALDAATELLLMKLKQYTHVTPLPLFDQTKEEADRGDMLDAIENGGEIEEHAPPF